ncbi:MAG: type II toxin-antitoxin system Phd/YefM family antitoxin [Victivallaceae bacterium]|nr:type II toxin-antitoxin system Phd/YefM family antitoxin [Victivallaceae bacterium]
MNAANNTWQLQTAKNRFSEVINYALSGHPQLVTRNGKPAVYVISAESYEKKEKRKSLKSLLLNSPCKNIEFNISRDKSDSGRRVEL